MNLQIFLALVAATTIVVAAYRHLKWSANIWLGGLFATAAIAALFLHNVNDSITWSIPVGDDLFRRGASVSILGKYYWLSIIGLLTGIALIFIGVVQRIRMPPPASQADSQYKNALLTEKEHIENALVSDITAQRNTLPDPAVQGKNDAYNPGGAIPGGNQSEPQGFEIATREIYEQLGNTFVRSTVNRLKAEITAALQKLANLRNTLTNNYYTDKARAYYRANADVLVPAAIHRLRLSVGATRAKYKNFTDRLPPQQEPEWDNRTSLKQLFFLSVVFTIIEFSVSYYFLESELGSDALKVAAIAVALVFILSIFASWIFRFMRSTNPIHVRVLASIFYLLVFGILFLGLGLLLEIRAVEIDEINWENVSTGYATILKNINNLVLFLVNLMAFGLFYWKFLLHFEKFPGYRRIKENRDQALAEFDAISQANNKNIINTVKKINDEATDNKNIADQAVKELQQKKAILEDIQGTLEPMFVMKLHPAYKNDIDDYRESNNANRDQTVYPSPAYFQKMAPFCAASEHFQGDYGVGEFLSRNADGIGQADDIRQRIASNTTAWGVQSQQLIGQLNTDFQNKLHGDGNQAKRDGNHAES